MRLLLFALLSLVLNIYSLTGQSKKAAFSNNRIGEFKGIVRDLCFTPSGKGILFAEKNQICLYDILTKSLLKKWEPDHAKSIVTLAMSSDSVYLVSGGQDSLLVIRKLNSTDLTIKENFHHGVITSLAIYKDQLAVGSSDGTVLLYHLGMRKILWQFNRITRDITKVKFSPDGNLLAVASLNSTIVLINGKDGKEAGFLKEHQNSVRDLCFDPGGTYLFSCGDDSRIIKWNLKKLICENTVNFRSGWLLTLDVYKDVLMFSGLNSQIRVQTNFVTYSTKIGVPVNKVLFVPQKETKIKILAATRGKGLYLIDLINFELTD